MFRMLITVRVKDVDQQAPSSEGKSGLTGEGLCCVGGCGREQDEAAS
jgi:hypothetical protein